MFYVITTTAIIYWFFFRRFQPPRYPAQKFSRSGQFLARSAVPPLRVSWSVAFTDYTPINNGALTEFWWFRKTKLDGKVRFLIEVSSKIFSKMPVNPYGRTGATGNGLLTRLGPNEITITVMWSRTQGYLRKSNVAFGKMIFCGYVDHPLNTDNAWIEAQIFINEVDMPQDWPYEKEEPEPWLKKILTQSGY